MNDHIPLMLQGYAAKRKLAELFQSKGLGETKQSPIAIAAYESIPAVQTDIKKSSKLFREKCRKHGLLPNRTPNAVLTSQRGQMKRDLTVSGFVFTLVYRLLNPLGFVAFKMGRRQGGPSRTGVRGRISKAIRLMTKNNSYDHISACDRTHSFSEIARKLGANFASRKGEHDETTARRWLFIMPQDWTWWVWLVTACLLLSGLMGTPEAFIAALLLSIAQSTLFLARERAFKAFPVELRLAYTLLLIICFYPPIHWFYWVPAVGTFALVTFGYCLMARVLSLLPWNRAEPITVDLLRRTFLSRPRLLDRADSVSSAGCGGGLCSIEAQIEPRRGRDRTATQSL